MISKSSIDAFLQMQRDDFSWIKEAPREELLAAIREICPQWQPKIPLFTHQLAALYLAHSLENFLLFLDMGTGKSLIALSSIQIRIHLKQIKKALFVVPNVVNVENILQETVKFTNLKAIALTGTKPERVAALKQKADIYVVNYDGLKVLMTELKPTKSKSKSKQKRTIVPYIARNFANQFDMLVLDEIHHVKHTTSLNYSLCELLSQHCQYRLGLTGTPFGRDPVGLWAQFNVIDHGETLGSSKALFLQALFKQKMNYFGGVDFYLPKKNEPMLHKMLLHRSLRYIDSECSDLPPLVTTNYKFNSHMRQEYTIVN